MVDYAMKCGVNYFDTAYPYHGVEECRKSSWRISVPYPRESYYLATKYPGHQLSSTYDPEAVFEEQLKKCGVEYLISISSTMSTKNLIQAHTDAKWGILGVFLRSRSAGQNPASGIFQSWQHTDSGRVSGVCGGTYGILPDTAELS